MEHLKVKTAETAEPKCAHTKTHVAVRHESGMKLVKCSDCNQTVYCG